jgi:hypothetical protein
MSDWIEFLRDDSTKKAYKTFKQELEDERAYDRRKSLFEKVKAFKESQEEKPKKEKPKKEKPKGKRQLEKEAKEKKEAIDELEDEWLRARDGVYDKHTGYGKYLYYTGRIKREPPKNFEEIKKNYDDDMKEFNKMYGKELNDFINYKTGEVEDKYKNIIRPKVPKYIINANRSFNEA